MTGAPVLASRTDTSDSLPMATEAMQTITTPRPGKNPICSMALAMWPPTGKPCACRLWVHSGARALPTANQAPLAAASEAPSNAVGRNLLASKISPPRNAPAAGRNSSQILPEVIVHTWLGVYA